MQQHLKVIQYLERKLDKNYAANTKRIIKSPKGFDMDNAHWSINKIEIRHYKSYKTSTIRQLHVHALSLISPAAGNLKSQSALLGTRLRILHLK